MQTLHVSPLSATSENVVSMLEEDTKPHAPTRFQRLCGMTASQQRKRLGGVAVFLLLTTFCIVLIAHLHSSTPETHAKPQDPPAGLAFADQTNQTTEEEEEFVLQGPHIQPQIRAGNVSTRGVNLGSWLVAEHWMTSWADLWNDLDSTNQTNLTDPTEYQAMHHADDKDVTRARFENHHATFFTENDIKEIAAAGLNTVRVPVGYWIVGFDKYDNASDAVWREYATDGLQYLDLLVRKWAYKHNVAVMISMHCAKGSQNGLDHSSPVIKGESHWIDHPDNIANTLDAVSFLAERYKDDVAFLGIGLMNEPAKTTTVAILYQYYQDAYRRIRATGNDCILIIAPLMTEQIPSSMLDFMHPPSYINVWVEWHRYFLWGFEKATTDDLMRGLDAFEADLKAWKGRNPIFIGEWSVAAPQDSFKEDTSGEKYQVFAQRQLHVMNQAKAGWTFWSWRMYGDENAANGWSLRNVLRNQVVALKD